MNYIDILSNIQGGPLNWRHFFFIYYISSLHKARKVSPKLDFSRSSQDWFWRAQSTNFYSKCIKIRVLNGAMTFFNDLWQNNWFFGNSGLQKSGHFSTMKCFGFAILTRSVWQKKAAFFPLCSFLTASYAQRSLKKISRSNPDIVLMYWYIAGHPGYVVNVRQFLPQTRQFLSKPRQFVPHKWHNTKVNKNKQTAAKISI